MNTKEELSKYLQNTGALKTPEIINAFRKVDRADFVREEYLGEAYEDYPLPIGRGQTISQPTTVAFMLELLAPKSGERVLDVGSGSGWTTALLAQIVGGSGAVFGVEIIPELVELGKKNLAKYNFLQAKIQQAEKDRLVPHHARGPGAGFDKILVSASGENLPEELIGQLKIGGRLVVPVKNSIWQIDKISETKVKKEEFPGFIFVPLK